MKEHQELLGKARRMKEQVSSPEADEIDIDAIAAGAKITKKILKKNKALVRREHGVSAHVIPSESEHAGPDARGRLPSIFFHAVQDCQEQRPHDHSGEVDTS